jgi:signal transduction histidine kinase/CheY-like chemotaxis protein
MVHQNHQRRFYLSIKRIPSYCIDKYLMYFRSEQSNYEMIASFRIFYLPFIILLTLSCATQFYFGQYTEKINLLKTKIINEENSVNLADYYLELSIIQLENEPDQSLLNALQSISISQSVHYTKGTINAHHQLGTVYTFNEQYENAKKELQIANELCLTYANYKDLAKGNILLAKVYWLSNLNNEAEDCIKTAIMLGEKTNNFSISSMAQVTSGDYNNHINKNNLALQYYLIAYEKALEGNDLKLQGLAALKIGTENIELNTLENGLDYLFIAKKAFEQLSDYSSLAQVNFKIGTIYQLQGNLNDAIIFYKNCLNNAQKNGSEYYIKIAYQEIAENYEKNQNYKEAYEYLQFYAAIKDTREISELEAQLALEKTNKELELISKENELHREQIEQEKNYRNIGYIVILIILALATFLYMSLRQRGKINYKLELATIEATRTKLEKEEFFAYTSHEIRTPLNAVVGISKILGTTELNETQQKYVKTIASSAQNILFIVNDVLDLSKIEKGELKFEQIPINLRDICEQIVSSLSFKKFEKNVDISYEIDDSIPQLVIGDPIRMNQILLNLADNALKFTKEGLVKIKIENNSAYETEKVKLKFSIIDTGIGIEEDKIKDIFESYQQAHISTTRQFGGTGLGLSISKLLVQKMGGELVVESKINSGSTFSFTLLLAPYLNQSIHQNEISLDEKIKNCSILVVDDNTLNREIFYNLVYNKANNVSVAMAINGKEAIDIIKQQHFDIILMDIQMPEMDGYETSRFIRLQLDTPIKDTPIIAMTAHVLEGVHQKCLDAGMDDSIAKPINTQILTSKINHLLKRRVSIESKINKTIIQENLQSINTNYLKEITNNNHDKINKYLKMIQNNLSVDLNRLVEYINELNGDEIGRCVHKIKGSLVYLDNHKVADEIAYLESVNKNNIDEKEINRCFNALQKEIILILNEINTLLPY